MSLADILLLTLFCLSCALARPSYTKYTPIVGTDHFFSYGKEAGDELLVHEKSNETSTDDGIFTRYLTKHIPFLDVEDTTKIHLSVNGYISFGEKAYDSYEPFHRYPFYLYDDSEIGIGAPQVDVWYTDLRFSSRENNQSCFSWQEHINDAVVEYANKQICDQLKIVFDGKRLLVATWKITEHYGEYQDKTVTFQVGILTNEMDTYVFLHYATENFDVEFFHPTAIGWQGENPRLYFEHRLSQFDDSDDAFKKARSLRMSTESNVGVPGQWIYRAFKHAKPMNSTGTNSTNAEQCPEDLINEVHHFCDYHFPGRYFHPYFDKNSKYHYSIYYVECVEGFDYGICRACAPTPDNGLYFSEKCDACLYGPPKAPENEVCPAPPPTPPVFNGCTPEEHERAADFCTRLPGQKPENYKAMNDPTSTHYYQCYNPDANQISTQGVCRMCPAGLEFCEKEKSLVGMCNWPWNRKV